MNTGDYQKKLSNNSNLSRIVSIIVGLIPILIVLFFLIRNFQLNGLIVLLFVLSLVAMYYRYTVFDWDLFISGDKIILKRWFKREIVFDRSKVSVSEVFFNVSIQFNVFNVIIHNQKFVVKLKAKTLEKLNMPCLLEKLEYRINRELELS